LKRTDEVRLAYSQLKRSVWSVNIAIKASRGDLQWIDHCIHHEGRGKGGNLQVKRPVVGVLIDCPETREATRATRATAESLNMLIEGSCKEGGLKKIEHDLRKRRSVNIPSRLNQVSFVLMPLP